MTGPLPRPRLLHRIVTAVHGWPRDHAVRVIAVGLTVALMGTYVYLVRLDIVSSRAALGDPERLYAQRSTAYRAEFGQDDDPLVLVIQAGTASGDARAEPTVSERMAMKGVADRWIESLSSRPDLFTGARARVDPAELGDYLLLYAPVPLFDALVDGSEFALPVLERALHAESLAGVLDAVAGGLDSLGTPSLPEPSPRDGAEADRGLDGRLALLALEEGLRWLRGEVEGAPGDGTPPPAATWKDAIPGDVDPDGYLFTDNGRLLTGIAFARGDSASRAHFAGPIAFAKEALEDALADVPDGVVLRAGLAGQPALEQEEMETSQSDFARSAGLALIAVSVLFMWAFRTVLRPMLAAMTLGMSISATFLFAWIAIGHLNVLAMVFAVIIVALGVDFAIHFFVHYRSALADGLDPTDAIARTQGRIGGAIWMDGVATGGAFLAAWFTDFPGLAELGAIAGVGLLICVAYTYLVFPAALSLVDGRWPPPTDRIPPALNFPSLGSRAPAPWAKPLLIVACLVSASGFLVGQTDFATNLLDLQPEEGDASRWQRRLLESEDRTRFAIATYTGADSLTLMRERFESLPEVSRTEAALPGEEPRRREQLAPICQTLGGLRVGLEASPVVRDVRLRLFRLRQTLRSFERSRPEAADALEGVGREAGALFTLLGEFEPRDATLRLTAAQRRMADAAREAVSDMRGLVCPPPLDVDGVPDPLRRRFVGSKGSLALFVYPSDNVWRGEPRGRFIEAIRTVDDAVFGGVVDFHESAQVMIRSFTQAAAYSAVVITLLLLAWTRSMRRTLVTLLPLVTGLGLLLLAMRWGPVPIRWNLANFFAVPILIGAGVAGGIHMTAGWLHGDRAFRAATAGVTFSSLTTMIGFGLLATGVHRGVASLGLILFLGIGFNLISCLVLLPPALAIFGQTPSPRSGLGFGAAGKASITILVLGLLGGTLQAIPAEAQGTGSTLLFVEPGDPAATESRAREFLNDMARYLEARVPALPAPVSGLISNGVAEARALVAERRPAFAVVPVSFYLAFLTERGVPVASVPRFGAHEDRWYVVTRRNGPDHLDALRGGALTAPAETDPSYLGRVVFPEGSGPGEAFRLQHADNMADAVFVLLEERGSQPVGLLLDEDLLRFFQEDELVWPGLRIVWRSEALPRDLAIALGEWKASELSSLRDALFGMNENAAGRELLSLMSSSGFDPVNQELLDRARDRYEGGR